MSVDFSICESFRLRGGIGLWSGSLRDSDPTLRAGCVARIDDIPALATGCWLGQTHRRAASYTMRRSNRVSR